MQSAYARGLTTSRAAARPATLHLAFMGSPQRVYRRPRAFARALCQNAHRSTAHWRESIHGEEGCTFEKTESRTTPVRPREEDRRAEDKEDHTPEGHARTLGLP